MQLDRKKYIVVLSRYMYIHLAQDFIKCVIFLTLFENRDRDQGVLRFLQIVLRKSNTETLEQFFHYITTMTIRH